ncbi:hypothetical protein ACFGQ5_003367 [Salmonella enterica]
MSDEPGRGKFVVQAAEARSSVWRRTAGRIRDEILHSLGRPPVWKVLLLPGS